MIVFPKTSNIGFTSYYFNLYNFLGNSNIFEVFTPNSGLFFPQKMNV